MTNNIDELKNEIKILTNDGEETVVYSHIEQTTELGQIVPANTLTNGSYYKVLFRTYDAFDNTSEWSNYQPFYCFSTPTLTFNISDEQIIHDSNFDLTLTYNQSENERLGKQIDSLQRQNRELSSKNELLSARNEKLEIQNTELKDMFNRVKDFVIKKCAKIPFVGKSLLTSFNQALNEKTLSAPKKDTKEKFETRLPEEDQK